MNSDHRSVRLSFPRVFPQFLRTRSALLEDDGKRHRRHNGNNAYATNVQQPYLNRLIEVDFVLEGEMVRQFVDVDALLEGILGHVFGGEEGGALGEVRVIA